MLEIPKDKFLKTSQETVDFAKIEGVKAREALLSLILAFPKTNPGGIRNI